MIDYEPQITVEKKDEYLFVTMPRHESLTMSKTHISELYDAVDHHDKAKVLVDYRLTREKIPIFELYDLCLHLASKFGLKGTKLAVIASLDAAYPDRFGENVVRNRGLDLIRFVDDEHEAIRWLLQPTPSVPD